MVSRKIALSPKTLVIISDFEGDNMNNRSTYKGQTFIQLLVQIFKPKRLPDKPSCLYLQLVYGIEVMRIVLFDHMETGIMKLDSMVYSICILLLESAIYKWVGYEVTKGDVENNIEGKNNSMEYMLGGDSNQIKQWGHVELIMDRSVWVDVRRLENMVKSYMKREFQRNMKGFGFPKCGSFAFQIGVRDKVEFSVEKREEFSKSDFSIKFPNFSDNYRKLRQLKDLDVMVSFIHITKRSKMTSFYNTRSTTISLIEDVQEEPPQAGGVKGKILFTV